MQRQGIGIWQWRRARTERRALDRPYTEAQMEQAERELRRLERDCRDGRLDREQCSSRQHELRSEIDRLDKMLMRDRFARTADWREGLWDSYIDTALRLLQSVRQMGQYHDPDVLSERLTLARKEIDHMLAALEQPHYASTREARGEAMTRRNSRYADRIEAARRSAQRKERLAQDDDRYEALVRRVASLRRMLRKAEAELGEERPAPRERSARPERPLRPQTRRAIAERQERIEEIRERLAIERRRQERLAAVRDRSRRRSATRDELPPKYIRHKRTGEVFVRVDD